MFRVGSGRIGQPSEEYALEQNDRRHPAREFRTSDCAGGSHHSTHHSYRVDSTTRRFCSNCIRKVFFQHVQASNQCAQRLNHEDREVREGKHLENPVVLWSAVLALVLCEPRVHRVQSLFCVSPNWYLEYCIRNMHITRWRRLRDGAPAPWQADKTPVNSAFGDTTGRAAKEMGGLDMLEAFSMRKPRAYFSDPVVHVCSSRQKEQ